MLDFKNMWSYQHVTNRKAESCRRTRKTHCDQAVVIARSRALISLQSSHAQGRGFETRRFLNVYNEKLFSSRQTLSRAILG